MQEDQILGTINTYLVKEQEQESLAGFPDILASDLIQDSVDAITFMMHLEESLGIRIKAHEIGPTLSKMTFRELAAELFRVHGAGAAKP